MKAKPITAFGIPHNDLENHDDVDAHHGKTVYVQGQDTTTSIGPMSDYTWTIPLGKVCKAAVVSLTGKVAQYLSETGDYWGCLVLCWDSVFSGMSYYMQQPPSSLTARAAYGAGKSRATYSDLSGRIFGDYIALVNAYLDGEDLKLVFRNYYGGGNKTLTARFVASAK